jgi:hypothetical protein
MKATLTFNLPEEQQEFKNAVDGWKAFMALEEIWQNVFRPARKHGYGHPKLQNLSDRDYEVIEALIDLYQNTKDDALGED